MTDPLLHAWLLAIATEEPESWYADSRLALADWLEERGDGRADAVRDNHPVAKGFRVKLPDGTISPYQGANAAFFLAGVMTPEATSRERQRLLALFPEVVLTGPCPRHEPLPAGVVVAMSVASRGVVGASSGDCLWCGNAPRVAPAPAFLLGNAEVFLLAPGASATFNGRSGPLLAFRAVNETAASVSLPIAMIPPAR